MKDLSGHGRTVLFVSHNMTSVESLCSRAVALEKGSIVQAGNTSDVIAKYLASSGDAEDHPKREWKDIENAPGDNRIRVRLISVKSVSGKSSTFLETDEDLLIEIEFSNLNKPRNLMVGLNFMTSMGLIIFTTGMAHHQDLADKVLSPGLYRASCKIPKNLLNDETYSIRLLFIEEGRHVLFKMEDALTITVHDTEKRFRAYMGKRPGVVAPKLDWSISQIGTSII